MRVLFAALALTLPTPAAAQQGQALFAAQCAACHQRDPRAPAAELAQRAPQNFAAFARIVRNGESPSGEMPAFTTDELSDADLRALHAYLQSVRARR